MTRYLNLYASSGVLPSELFQGKASEVSILSLFLFFPPSIYFFMVDQSCGFWKTGGSTLVVCHGFVCFLGTLFWQGALTSQQYESVNDLSVDLHSSDCYKYGEKLKFQLCGPIKRT